MGFKRFTYRLVWPEGSPLHGLEVRMRPMPIETLEHMSELYENSRTEMKKLPREMAAVVQEGIVSWNLTDENDNPVPCTNVLAEGVELVTAIVQAWQQAANQVSAPLPQGSPDGGPSPEELIPMEIPSSSLVNSNTPN